MSKKSKVISIHQPNLFPWLGFFSKIYHSDEFVLLDHTINNRTEGIYTRRVQLLNTQGEASYLTIPIKKIDGSDFGALNKWEVNYEINGFPKKQIQSIKQTYSKHPFFNEVIPIVEDFFEPEKNIMLTQKNKLFIEKCCELLEIKTPISVSSGLSTLGNSTELLISIIKTKNGTHYLSGKGGDKYQDPILFKDENIGLNHLNFKHPIYSQLKSENFISGLSIIDCLMNLGFEQTSDILKKQ